jgi:hypothetical protein
MNSKLNLRFVLFVNYETADPRGRNNLPARPHLTTAASVFSARSFCKVSLSSSRDFKLPRYFSEREKQV